MWTSSLLDDKEFNRLLESIEKDVRHKLLPIIDKEQIQNFLKSKELLELEQQERARREKALQEKES